MSESAERIYALLVDANPVPDVENLPEILAARPHLYVIDTRSDEMQTQTRPDIGEAPATTPPRRRGWIAAVAAAAAVLVAVGVGAWLFSATDTTTPPATEAPVVTTIPATTAPVTTAALTQQQLDQARIDVAEAALADWASGDVDAFFGNFAEDGVAQGTPASDASVRRDLAFYMGLGQALDVAKCEPVIDSRIQCMVATTDDLSRSIGAEVDVAWVFEIREGAIDNLIWTFGESDLDPFAIVEDMVGWIAENHPDVFDDVFRATVDRCDASNFNFYGTWCSSPAAAEELLRLGPEFIAQANY